MPVAYNKNIKCKWVMFNYYGNHTYRKNSFVCFYLDYVVCLVVSVVAFVLYVIGIKHFNVSCWLTLSTCIFFQFVVVASAISYRRPSYGGQDVTSRGEAIGWLVALSPVVIMIATAGFQVLRQGRPSRENFISLVSGG